MPGTSETCDSEEAEEHGVYEVEEELAAMVAIVAPRDMIDSDSSEDEYGRSRTVLLVRTAIITCWAARSARSR
jgi:hypothetical protein